jgi:hypothetical protein
MSSHIHPDKHSSSISSHCILCIIFRFCVLRNRGSHNISLHVMMSCRNYRSICNPVFLTSMVSEANRISNGCFCNLCSNLHQLVCIMTFGLQRRECSAGWIQKSMIVFVTPGSDHSPVYCVDLPILSHFNSH